MKKTLFLILFIICSFMSFYLNAYQYELAVTAIFKNEAPYLKEWIEFHHLVGVEHFYLYNHDSSDNFQEVLSPYIESGIVEIVDWKTDDFQFTGQKMAYFDAIQKVKGQVKWLAIIDTDEFIVPKKFDSIKQFLKQFDREGIAGIGINWQMFGTSSVSSIQPNELLIEKLVQKAPSTHHENLHIKSIVRPEYVVSPHVHYFDYLEGWKHVDAAGNDFEKSQSIEVQIDQIQINHYWTRDEQFFNTIKIPRRLFWGENLANIYTRLEILNQIEDLSIQRFIPLLKNKITDKNQPL